MDWYIVYVLRGVMPQRSFECNDIVLFEYFAKKIVRPYVTFLAPVSHSVLVSLISLKFAIVLGNLKFLGL